MANKPNKQLIAMAREAGTREPRLSAHEAAANVVCAILNNCGQDARGAIAVIEAGSTIISLEIASQKFTVTIEASR